MKLSPKFNEALVYAAELHAEQNRKGDEEIPYIAHLLGVTSIALEYGANEEQAIAALLHDAVEDQGGTAQLEIIRQKYGETVARIVSDCSDAWESPKPPWKERKDAYIQHLPSTLKDSRLVSLADKIHNARSITKDYRQRGEDLWPRFKGGRGGTLWYYRTLVDTFQKIDSNPMIDELERVVSELETLTKEENIMNDITVKSEEGTFKNRQGIELYQRWWVPEGESQAFIVMIHGIAEHCGRYADKAEFFARHHYSVASYDLRNHGHSGDKSVYVNSFDDYLTDTEDFLETVRAKANGKPIFLLGHSMGGAIVSLYTITRQPDFLKGLILSSPAVKIGKDITPLLIAVADILSALVPKMKIVQLKNTSISHDPEIMRLYDEDPLNYRDKIPARTGAELNRAIKAIQANMEAITLPVLIFHGGADSLVDIDGSKMLYQRVRSNDKTFNIYEGLYHETMNEFGKEGVLTDIVNWLDAHLA